MSEKVKETKVSLKSRNGLDQGGFHGCDGFSVVSTVSNIKFNQHDWIPRFQSPFQNPSHDWIKNHQNKFSKSAACTNWATPNTTVNTITITITSIV